MSLKIVSGLASKSVDASLTEVEMHSRDSNVLHRGTVNIGPFSVFSLSNPCEANDLGTPVFRHEIDEPLNTLDESFSDLESLLDAGNLTGFDDLLHVGHDLISFPLDEQLHEDSLTSPAHAATTPIEVQSGGSVNDSPNLHDKSMNVHKGMTLSLNHFSTQATEAELLTHGQGLLKYFKDALVPTYSPLPVCSKSPWETLNCCAAVHTLADLTYLQNSDVKQASMANLFGILACSAFTIAKKRSNLSSISSSMCEEFHDYASMRAKKCLQESLKAETWGQQKAKYKDQLMAFTTLIALAVR